jgi:hypothetical protein
MSGIAQILRDTDPLIDGTHYGATGVVIRQINKDFRSCGARPGLAVRNITDLTSGHIVSATEEAVTTDITFHNGDKYEIYHTATYNSVLSKHYEDRRYGHKVTSQDELNERGLFPDDTDINEDGELMFADDQPWQTRV